MKEEHRRLLQKNREQVNNTAADLKAAFDAGYVVDLNIDNVNGKIIKFEVTQRIPVDIDAPSPKTN